jgi:acyl carrier protein
MNQKIIQAIKDVFPTFEDTDFSVNMRFDRIRDWDSMNSVNFQMALETIFKGDFSDAPLNGQNTIADLISFIKEKALNQ